MLVYRNLLSRAFVPCASFLRLPATMIPQPQPSASQQLSPLTMRAHSVGSNSASGMAEQWALWPYFQDNITWHADWLRLDATTGQVKEHFRGLRDFQAQGGDDGPATLQHNTYMYNDDRGTVSEGPLCGPWKISPEICSTDSGIVHPSRPQMRTLLGPDRTCAWLMENISAGDENGNDKTPTVAMELFLGDGEYLRCSVGIVYDPITNLLSHVGIIREDSRGFDSPEWNSHDETFKERNTEDGSWDALSILQGSTTEVHHRNVVTSFTVSVPGPEQSQTVLTEQQQVQDHLSTLLVVRPTLQQGTSIWQLGDNMYLACPKKLGSDTTDNFRAAIAWKKSDKSLASVMDIRYADGRIKSMTHTKFTKR